MTPCFLAEKIMLGLPPSVSVTKEDTLAPYEPVPGGPINPPIITHTAATPMATPQGSPNEATNNNKDIKNNLTVVRAFGMTSSSIDSIDRSSSVSPSKFKSIPSYLTNL
jgi:hypothetical protein